MGINFSSALLQNPMVRQNSLVKVRLPFFFLFPHSQKTCRWTPLTFLPPFVSIPCALLFAEPARATGFLRQGALERLRLDCHKTDSDSVLSSSSVPLILMFFTPPALRKASRERWVSHNARKTRMHWDWIVKIRSVEKDNQSIVTLFYSWYSSTQRHPSNLWFPENNYLQRQGWIQMIPIFNTFYLFKNLSI